jgi:hypothetical protein
MLKRVCKVCGHPKRNHHSANVKVAKCHNCSGWVMFHNFVLDNLKYLEEKSEQLTHKRSE